MRILVCRCSNHEPGGCRCVPITHVTSASGTLGFVICDYGTESEGKISPMLRKNMMLFILMGFTCYSHDCLTTAEAENLGIWYQCNEGLSSNLQKV